MPPDTDFARPDATAVLSLHQEPVIADWVDYNDHMNVAYYVLMFDHATDALLDHLGMDAAYRAETGGSVFVVETHVTYRREVVLHDQLVVTTRIVDCDEKRVHVFHTMFLSGSDDVVATGEFMILHVDLKTRWTSPFPAAARATMEDLARRQRQSAPPRNWGGRSESATSLEKSSLLDSSNPWLSC